MRVADIPPMKPVLVTDISDNIGVLQKHDTIQQQTVLSARAIADIFKCAPISKDNAADYEYFVGNKVDLDLITTACSRTLTEGQYVNGPVITIDQVTEGKDAKWSANHSPLELTGDKVPHGFLYVFSVLDNSELSWEHYDGTESIPDWIGETEKDRLDYRKTNPRAKSKKIRQVFVPNEINQKYNITERSRYDVGVAWTRYGTLNETTGQYDWEPWFIDGKTHDGAEYFFQITTSSSEITNPLYDAVYHVYDSVKMILPNANLDGYKPGMKIIVEVHPPRVKDTTSSCDVYYQDTRADGTDFDPKPNQMHLLITPRTRINTKDVFGQVSEDALGTAIATFELVEVPDPSDSSKTFRTWELDAGVEETDFTAGLAQMLSEHTATPSGDLVQFQRESISGYKKLDVIHAISTCGYGVFRFLKHDNSISKLTDNNFYIQVKKIHLGSDACFVKVIDKTVTPDPNTIYYVRTGTTFALADNYGHPGHFVLEFDYYTIDLTHAEIMDVIQIPDNGSIRNYLTLNDLEWDKLRGYNAFFNRNDLMQVTINVGTDSVKSFADFQNKVFPTAIFVPSVHDAYIHKGSINPGAFTYDQLMKLQLTGALIDDVDLDVNGEILQSMLNGPASTRALIEAYTYLARILQQKGMLFGNVAHINCGQSACDMITTPGYHYVRCDNRKPGHTYPPEMPDEGCNIVVLSNGYSDAGKIHEDSQGILKKADKIVQIAFLMTLPAKIYSRVGIWDYEERIWKFGPWEILSIAVDWKDITNKPLFFRSRWDYFENPNWLLNRADSSNVEVVHNGETNRCEIIHHIRKDEISSIMQASEDPEYDENVNFDEPQFVVGVESLTPSPWAARKSPTEDGFDYVIDVEMPDATESQINRTNAGRRRKVRFLWLNNPEVTGWMNLRFRLHYASSVGGRESYLYDRVWWGSSKSYCSLEFEQVDLNNGDRAWCPIVVG